MDREVKALGSGISACIPLKIRPVYTKTPLKKAEEPNIDIGKRAREGKRKSKGTFERMNHGVEVVSEVRVCGVRVVQRCV